MMYRCALLVEDDEVARNVVCRALKAYGVGRVVTASRLTTAKAMLNAEVELLVAPALIAKESCLPLIEHACQQARTPAIIMIGGAAPSQLIFKLGRLSAIKAYLEKPVASRVLWQCLDSLHAKSELRRSEDELVRPSTPASFAWSPERVERAIERYRAGRELTNAETETLRCALIGMRRPEIAVERGVSINTLKTQVRSLLNKCTAPSLESLAARIYADTEHRNAHGA